MNAKTYKEIYSECSEYGIDIQATGDKIQFYASNGHVVAWMYRKPKEGAAWGGYTSSPDVTGIKYGTKGEVANWCLDWAANGF